jgi:UPF0755 protein
MLLVLFVIALALAAGWLVWFAKAPVALPAASVDFSIVPGSSLKSATRQIVDAGVPISQSGFNLLARIYGKQTQIKAGSYELREGATPWALLQKITQGDFQMTDVVFIEGRNFAQMRAALNAHPDVRHDTRDMSDEQIMARVGAPGVPPEGMFFPDTYLFAKGESDLAVLTRAHRVMAKELESAWAKRAPELPPRGTGACLDRGEGNR